MGTNHWIWRKHSWAMALQYTERSSRSRIVPTSQYIEYHSGEPHQCLGACNRNHQYIEQLELFYLFSRGLPQKLIAIAQVCTGTEHQ